MTNAPLDMDLNSVDLSLPLVADGIYDLRIEKAEIKPTSSGGAMISLDFVTTAPCTSQKGEPLGAGIHIFDNVNTVPTGKATMDMVVRNVAALVQAAKIQGATMQNVPTWVPQLTGRVLRAKVSFQPEGVSKAGKAFKAKNVIASYVKS